MKCLPSNHISAKKFWSIFEVHGIINDTNVRPTIVIK